MRTTKLLNDPKMCVSDAIEGVYIKKFVHIYFVNIVDIMNNTSSGVYLYIYTATTRCLMKDYNM